MNNEDLSDTLKKCSENDLEDMIDRGVLKNINDDQLKSLLNNPHINISLFVLKKICYCPYVYRNSISATQYKAIFNLIKRIEPVSLESALEEYFLNHDTRQCFDSILWTNLWEKESKFLLNNPNLNFFEDLLETMYTSYDKLGEMIQFYEWYNYSLSSDVFFQKISQIQNSDLEMKILKELEAEDEFEIKYIISVNLLKFVDKRSLWDLLNSPKSNLFEILIKIFIEYEREGIYDSFELCEDLIYQLGDNITKNLKQRVIYILEDRKIESLKMIFKFRWLEYFNQGELNELTNNSKINFLENFGDIIFTEILDEHNYYRGNIIKYLPRILLNVLKFIDNEFLKKTFERDELYDQNKEDFIWLLNDASANIDKQRKDDVIHIVNILNT